MNSTIRTNLLDCTLRDGGYYNNWDFPSRLVNNYLNKVSTKSKRSPHMLRHSFATHLLNNGAEINSVKELLGHASLAATQIYTHTSMEKIKSIYKKSHPRN